MQKSVFTPEYLHFLNELRRAREEAGLTQGQLAERLHESQSWVSKCERGERRLDMIEVLAFCRAIGVNFPEFASRVERATNQSTS